MQRLRRQAWQWRRLSLVMVQLPLNGQVKEALRFMLRLHGEGGGREGGERSRERMILVFGVNRLERTIVCVQEQTSKSTDKMPTEDSYQGALMF